jgi:hypothetical protein
MDRIHSAVSADLLTRILRGKYSLSPREFSWKKFALAAKREDFGGLPTWTAKPARLPVKSDFDYPCSTTVRRPKLAAPWPRRLL